MQLVLLGEKVFPTSLGHLLTNHPLARQSEDQSLGGLAGLSQREAQILACLLNGTSNKQIANELNIAEGTVKVHLKAIMKKINVRNRTQAAMWAANNGIRVHSPFGQEKRPNGCGAWRDED
jgi:two-component system nitrate/nitrite response regulator NarL